MGANHRSHTGTGTMVFGMELILDLDGCDPGTLADRDALARYAADLVDLIEMKAYGEPILEDFGHDDPVTAGWTLVQLIETSSVTGHFSDHLGRAHINIFSCRAFDPEKAAVFTGHYFASDRVTRTVLIR
jgi:S-adenosylmethionine decarboxylase